MHAGYSSTLTVDPATTGSEEEEEEEITRPQKRNHVENVCHFNKGWGGVRLYIVFFFNSIPSARNVRRLAPACQRRGEKCWAVAV